jgi:hypothetical protein
LPVPFEVPEQHVGNQVTAQHEEDNHTDDACTLKYPRPRMSEQDGANGSAAEDVQAIQPRARFRFPGCRLVLGSFLGCRVWGCCCGAFTD